MAFESSIQGDEQFDSGFLSIELFDKEDTSLVQLNAASFISIDWLSDSVEAARDQSNWQAVCYHISQLVRHFLGKIASTEYL